MIREVFRADDYTGLKGQREFLQTEKIIGEFILGEYRRMSMMATAQRHLDTRCTHEK